LVTQRAIAPALTDVLNSENLYSWSDLPANQQQVLGAALTPNSQIECVAYPTSANELAQVIASAHQHRWRVLPFGNASKISWGALTQNINLAVSTKHLDRLINHAVGDMTVTAEAGMKLADLQSQLAQAGQFLPLDPLYADVATLGGMVATGSAGSLCQRYGGVRDLVLGISLVRSDGQIAKAGGQVVKNVAGYDLMKVFTGSFGTLGLITQLTFRVYALPETSQTVVLFGAVERVTQAVSALLTSTLTPTALDLLSSHLLQMLGIEAPMGLILQLQTISAAVQAQVAQLQAIAQTFELQTQSYGDADEQRLWQRLRETIESQSETATILCKIGVQPTSATSMLTQVQTLFGETGLGLVHLGCGVGVLRLQNSSSLVQTLGKLRQYCQQMHGFLTILEAPPAVKQALDVWGYAGNATAIMQRLKTQFDPHVLLSPHRSVGGL
jgi:glycolate oxidase FAD binding subunit